MERLAPHSSTGSILQRFAQDFPPLDEQVVVAGYLDIRENRDVGLPWPRRLTLDITEIEEDKGSLPVVVMPYAGMAPGDKVVLTLKAFLYEGEPFEPKEWTEILGDVDDVGEPVGFKVPRSVFEQPVDLVGCYVELYASVFRGEDEVSSSLSQNFFIERGAEESHFLRAPNFKDVTGHTLFADELSDGIELQLHEQSEAQAGDSVVVFDGEEGLVTWGTIKQPTPGEPLVVTVPASWLEKQVGARSVKVQYAGANRSYRTHALLFEVARTRALDAPIVSSANTFRALRTGFEASVLISDKVSGGTITMHLGTEETLGKETVRTSFAQTDAYVVREKHFVFYFSPQQLGVLLGRSNVVAYYSVGAADRYSPPTASSFKPPEAKELRYFPRLQCPDAAGSSGLSKAHVRGRDIPLYLGSWLLMSAGQIIDIKAEVGTSTYPLLRRAVTESDLEKKSIDTVLKASDFEHVLLGQTIRFVCDINFNNGSGASFQLTPIDIVVIE